MKTNNLLRLVKEYFDEGYFDGQVRSILEKSTYTDEEIDYMWKYVFKIQRRVLKSQGNVLTMSTLKREIGRMTGIRLSDNYTNTVSKDDLFKLYQFITSLPSEYIKDRLDG